jgi:hypothetical protein
MGLFLLGGVVVLAAGGFGLRMFLALQAKPADSSFSKRSALRRLFGVMDSPSCCCSFYIARAESRPRFQVWGRLGNVWVPNNPVENERGQSSDRLAMAGTNDNGANIR